MKNIHHKFRIETSPEKLFKSITDGENISKWWTTSAELEPIEGAKGVFNWVNHQWTVKITQNRIMENQLVEWSCDSSNMQNTDAWKGSSMIFKIIDNKDGSSTLDFQHINYKDSPCYEVCNDGWSFVLGSSLRSLLEKGSGEPYQS